MACRCKHKSGASDAMETQATATMAPSKSQAAGANRTRPLDQCLFCAQKHADEALCCMNEFMYEQENRSFVHGSIRSVVNHTFKDWPQIAMVARESALLWQQAKFKEAQDKLKEAAAQIDAQLLADNHEIKARLDEAVKAKEKPDTGQVSGS